MSEFTAGEELNEKEKNIFLLYNKKNKQCGEVEHSHFPPLCICERHCLWFSIFADF